MIDLRLGDCIEVMAALPDQSIDLVLCDLPYGTTYASWDNVVPADALWRAYARLVRGKGAIVLHGSQPFTSMLVASNPSMFRYEWVWDKVHGANFANASWQPIKTHENVLVFSAGKPPYYPQKTAGAPNHSAGVAQARRSPLIKLQKRSADDFSGMKHPQSIQTFAKHSSHSPFHPTQKPLALAEYLVNTYSLPGDTVMDNCMGSGTTGVAAIVNKRSFVGIEKDEKYFRIASARIEAAAL